MIRVKIAISEPDSIETLDMTLSLNSRLLTRRIAIAARPATKLLAATILAASFLSQALAQEKVLNLYSAVRTCAVTSGSSSNTMSSM